MSPACALNLATSAVAGYTGVFHGWIHLHRRNDRSHLWLALTALSVAWLSGTNAGLYESTSLESAELWQRLQFAGAGVVVLGFLNFTLCFVGLERPRVSGAAALFGAGVAALALGTDTIFNGVAVERRVDAIGLRFVESGIDATGELVLATFLGFVVYIVSLQLRHLPRSRPEARPIVFTTVLWAGTVASDCAVLSGFYQFPYLIEHGYLAVVLGLSAVLVRRFARSMDEVERLAGNLHQLAQARSDELRQKDLQLAHGERMAAIGTLAAGIAHEINNPIAYVTANVNRLAELWEKPGESDEVADILGECREGVERVRAIVSDLLSISRRSDGRSELVNLRSVVSSVLPILRHQAHERAQLVADCREVPLVLGDARLLGQVVMNLVLNGLQSLPEGATAGHRVWVSTGFENGMVRLEVHDTGTGIAPAVLPKIFDPFFTTKESGKGTGLGLAITYQIVQQHGGRIRVQSAPGATQFSVELPPAPQGGSD